MSLLSQCSAVIFDLDGLVLDTESTYCLAWQQAAAVMNYPLTDAFCQSLSGLHVQAVEMALLAACGAKFDLARFNQLAGECWRQSVQTFGIPVKPGVLEVLDFLKQQGVPFALATNSRAANARECLGLAGLNEAFRLQATRDDVESGKPAPDVFLWAAQLLQTPIQQCLILEDSLTGVLAAHRAGACTVMIPSVLPVSAEAERLCYKVMPDLLTFLPFIRAEFAHL
jgi:beta-phosphoglucomutase